VINFSVRFILITIVLVFGAALCSFAATSQPKVPDMMLVQGGLYMMGEVGGKDNPAHAITVRSFYAAPLKVTVAQWREFTKVVDVEFDWSRDYVMEGSREPYPWRENDPIAFVTWYEAVEFCNWMSHKYRLQPAYAINGRTGYSRVNGRSVFSRAKVTWNRKANGFRLPTEAEWEYAARGGAESKGTHYAGSDDIEKVAWYEGNAKGKLMPVGQRLPNELGLYDMSGDVGEWCWDFFDSHYYGRSPTENPVGPNAGYAPEWADKAVYEFAHSTRGGDVLSPAEYSAVYKRTFSPDANRSWIGVRIVRNAESK
jgi:formylglycine-generating enzyme